MKILKQFFCFHKYEEIKGEPIIKYVEYFPEHVFGIKYRCKKCGKEKELIK